MVTQTTGMLYWHEGLSMPPWWRQRKVILEMLCVQGTNTSMVVHVSSSDDAALCCARSARPAAADMEHLWHWCWQAVIFCLYARMTPFRKMYVALDICSNCNSMPRKSSQACDMNCLAFWNLAQTWDPTGCKYTHVSDVLATYDTLAL